MIVQESAWNSWFLDCKQSLVISDSIMDIYSAFQSRLNSLLLHVLNGLYVVTKGDSLRLCMYVRPTSNTHTRNQYGLHVSSMVYVLMKWPLFLRPYSCTDQRLISPKQSNLIDLDPKQRSHTCVHAAWLRRRWIASHTHVTLFKSQLGIVEWKKHPT